MTPKLTAAKNAIDAAVNTLKASDFEYWLAYTFGRHTTTTDKLGRTTISTWRGKRYLIKYEPPALDADSAQP